MALGESDVDRKAATVRVFRSKTGYHSVLAVPRAIIDLLPPPQADGRLWPVRRIDDVWRRLLRVAGLKPSGLCFQSLRHSRLTSFADGGVPPREIQRIAVHTNLGTTTRYLAERAAPIPVGEDIAGML